jgi:cation transport ATPase
LTDTQASVAGALQDNGSAPASATHQKRNEVLIAGALLLSSWALAVAAILWLPLWSKPSWNWASLVAAPIVPTLSWALFTNLPAHRGRVAIMAGVSYVGTLGAAILLGWLDAVGQCPDEICYQPVGLGLFLVFLLGAAFVASAVCRGIVQLVTTLRMSKSE